MPIAPKFVDLANSLEKLLRKRPKLKNLGPWNTQEVNECNGDVTSTMTMPLYCPLTSGVECARSYKVQQKCVEESMKKSLLTLGVATTLMIALSIGRVQGQQDQSKEKVIFFSADKANFQDKGNGTSMAPIWGDADKGAHATFTKFVPGFDAGMHTHTNDVLIVVIKGAYLYKDDAGEKRVSPGDFLRVPGGHKHWSGGDKKEGALFYEESSGKFDLIPTK
jgi:mannose-6-phosphate isomerase-like protein (cupin superfamily)